MHSHLPYRRSTLIQQAATEVRWDILVIGGGATGLGIAVDAANRGYKTLLLEAADFAKGTSSRSTKLVHGGVRYLAQGNIRLVYDALHERGLLLQNAPHLVNRQAFLIPCYGYADVVKYFTGLKLYDWLSGRLSLGASQFVRAGDVIKAMPFLNRKNLVGGVRYFDGQFNDARLAINLWQTSIDEGAVALNYFPVTGLLKNEAGKIIGVEARDSEENKEYRFEATTVINATGVFVDEIRKMDNDQSAPMVSLSQGAHAVVDRSFLPGSEALMIPKTPDGRVLFAVPWGGHLLLGTTDTPVTQHTTEPVVLENETAFILKTVGDYLSPAPQRSDVLCTFAGLRPLVAVPKSEKSTKELSRDHAITVSETNLTTITGGKWTTYRKMAEDAVNTAIKTGGLPSRPCRTRMLTLHGATSLSSEKNLAVYGSDAASIQQLINENPELGQRISDAFSYTEAEVIWAIRNEGARTVEDILARRLRILFLNAKEAIAAAPRVAELMQAELNRDTAWAEDQIKTFNRTAANYLPYGHPQPTETFH